MARDEIVKDENNKSWKNIKQSSKRKAVTQIARKRKLVAGLKLGGVFAAFLLLCTGIGLGIYYFKEFRSKLLILHAKHPLKEVVFESDGMLNQRWFEQNIELPENIDLIEVDHFELRERLLDYGQIKTASITKEFPERLLITVGEREPILKAQVAGPDGEVEILLIAADGVVYNGTNYPGATIDKLPYLEVDRFARGEKGIEPVPGMEVVNELLQLARYSHAEIYTDWRVISCKKFDGDVNAPGAAIVVKGKRVKETIFGPVDFEKQLSLLANTIDFHLRKNVSKIRRVDLSLGETVMVRNYLPFKPNPHHRN